MDDYHAALNRVRTTLAADCACQPDDWQRDELTLVEAREMAGRRRFPFRAEAFNMITMGLGVVISCSAERQAWVKVNLGPRSRDQLFAAHTLALIADYVRPAQQVLAGPHLCHICARSTFRPAAIPDGFVFEVYSQERVAELYDHTGFSHALSYRPDNPAPDILAIVARCDGQVAGIAGVGADSDQLWQIGIDVMSEYQGQGLGKALVSRATEAVFEQGKTPYYSHSISNVRSGNLARAVGYQWAWTGTHVRDTPLGMMRRAQAARR